LNKNAVQNCDAFVYGSLACRDELSKTSLLKLLEITKGLKIFDVNLRAPHSDLQFIVELMKQSDLVKLNEEEFIL